MVVTDTAKNTFSVNSSNSATLDQDIGEQNLLKLTVASPAVNAATAPALAFTVAGLDAENSGAVTFTHRNGKMVQVSVKGTQTNYTVDLSSLADGAITSSLTVNPDTAGNTFKPVAGTALTLTQINEWTNSGGADWAKSLSNWTTWNNAHALPTGTIDAYIDATHVNASSPYKVAINSSSDTAYALVLNDPLATIADNSGGTLTLLGAGGQSNPANANGALTITAGTFNLAGGVLNSGAISIGPGGTLNVSANSTLSQAVSGSGAITIQNGATAINTFSGTLNDSGPITNKGTITVSGAATLAGTISGNGSFSLSNGGSLELVGADSQNVTFTGTTGTLKLDHSLTAPFTGQLSGLSTVTDVVDLADLTWIPGKTTVTPKPGNKLLVSNGTNSVTLNLASGNSSSWSVSPDSGSGTLVADPPVSGSFHENDVSGLRLAGSALAHPPDSRVVWAVHCIKLRLAERRPRHDTDHRSASGPATSSISSACILAHV
jgi:hypothetical protein